MGWVRSYSKHSSSQSRFRLVFMSVIMPSQFAFRKPPFHFVQETFAKPPQDWNFFTTSGFNIAKGKRVDLTLVLKPE